jgi:hypothetical protein
LPIFSPTVTTMRFQPIMVPRPSAMATAIFTQVGMNLVALSSEPLFVGVRSVATRRGEAGFLVLHQEADRLGGQVHVVAGVADDVSAGTLASEPYADLLADVATSTASAGRIGASR